jgi:hypothetical protein
MSNRIEGTRRKLSHMPTGRLKPLRLFSTLLPFQPSSPRKGLERNCVLTSTYDEGTELCSSPPSELPRCDEFNHVSRVDDIVRVIVTCNGDLVQNMLPVGAHEFHLCFAVGLVRTEQNVFVQDNGDVAGLVLVLDEELTTI